MARGDMALVERYLQLAEEQPAAEALIFERGPHVGVHLSWAELADRSDSVRKSLRDLGVSAGDRCAVTLRDHPDMIPLLLALWRLQAPAVLIDDAWGPRLVNNVLRHSGARYGLDLDNGLQTARLAGPDDPYPHPLPEGSAMLGYTSGSTGDPKGIAFTQSKLALTMQAAAAASAMHRGAPPRRIACSSRLSGSGVLNLHYVWAAFADAAVVVLPELDVTTARDYWHRIEAHLVEQAYLVPTLVELVNHVAASRPGEVPGPLCLTGSAPLSPRTQAHFEERFGLPLLNAFGLSETMCASFFGHVGPDGRATNEIGMPWLIQARVVSDLGTVVDGEGEGELQLAGPTLIDGYYGNPEATAAAFAGRWFRTGDIVRRGPSGRYCVVGRAKDVVMKGGFAVYLNEVEEAALSVSGVIEAAAVPLVNPDGGEDLGLLVRVDPDVMVSADDVLRLVQRDLGRQRAPRRAVAIADRLPRTGQDKLDRRAVSAVWDVATAPTSARTVAAPS